MLLDGQDAATPLAGALARAAEQALGPGASVAIRGAPPSGVFPDEASVAAARAAGAVAVARVSWNDATRLSGSLQLLVIEGGRRAAASLAFEGSDPPLEKGRALGLVLASLLSREAGSRPSEAVTRVEGSAPAEAARPAAASPAAALSAIVPPAEPPRPSRRGWMADAAAGGGVALGGAGSGVGGAIGAGQTVRGDLGWRVGAQVRVGSVGAAQASMLSAALAVGFTLDVVRSLAKERLALSLRGDGLLLYESLSHFSSDDPQPVRKGRWLPGLALLAEAQWRVSPGAAVFVAAGPEVALGRTDVQLHGLKVAEVVPWRVSTQAGLRIWF